ncbi:VOC family protein [Prauserella endophytica]|uniref:4a-hydroxytetrahydrobiopterin dehydratase n=1 Tax=Prauserella endophytica TaxID=1592324 RepID=A0ABY2S2N4_9PSEU|nr:VOC family protein [Prauserella endophytica]TKG69702.1 4a-hydroxytetrahydrobiopterin dehydratase [Prauserella endophytica]
MSETLSHHAVSAAVTDLGWRYVLDGLRAGVPVESLRAATDVAARIVAGLGAEADEHVVVDCRPGGVIFTVRSRRTGSVEPGDLDLARRISELVTGLGLRITADAGPSRSVQALEIAIDALDTAAIRPFWREVLGYTDGAGDALVDPAEQGPAVWFQRMTAPRPQRNRVHLDISVPHDEGPGRVERALAAGGVLRSDRFAPAFWVLADAEGNEACVSTWQGRDP